MKKVISLIIITSMIIASIFSIEVSKASEEINFYEQVLKIACAEINEIGIEATVANDNSLNECYKSLKEAFKLHNKMSGEKIISNNTDYLQFNIDDMEGNIQRIDANKIKVSINQKTNKNNTGLLKGILRDAFNDNTNQYLYIKSKIDDNYHEINDKIVKFLDESGATDLNTVSLNNGYSTICNTHKYYTKKSGGKDFDFQVAIMNYGRKSEIIIGIPEITVAF